MIFLTKSLFEQQLWNLKNWSQQDAESILYGNVLIG